MTTEATTEKTKKKPEQEALDRVAAGVAQPMPPTQQGFAIPPGIPVQIVRFEKPQQVPGKSMAETLESETAKNKRRWEIEFIPPMRHFRISYFAVDGSDPEQRFIHETKVKSWDPA